MEHNVLSHSHTLLINSTCLGILAKNMPKRLAGYHLLNSYNFSYLFCHNTDLFDERFSLESCAQYVTL